MNLDLQNNAVWFARHEDFTMKSHSNFAFILSFIFILLNGFAMVSEAVYEGSANANMMIQYYERKGKFGKAALWQETAAKCIDVISIPLAKVTMEYHKRNDNIEPVEKLKAEISDIKSKRDKYLQRAEMNWKKANEDKKELDAEKANADKFIAEWIVYYPSKFYEFGIYENLFKVRIDELKEQQKFSEALLLEAEASDMCVRQYQNVTVKYFQTKAKVEHNARLLDAAQQSRRQADKYQKICDKHLRRSAMLRALAKQNPENWPPEADKKDFSVPQSKHNLTADKAIKLARTDKRIQQILKKHEDVREFAWFQGFYWTVSYYTYGWGNLCIAFVDDETGKLVDILSSPGNLEIRESDEEEREDELRLSPEKVVEIVKKNPKVKEYFKKHPEAITYANYNWDYNCWIVEVVIENREVGVVTVSDKTEKVLEVALEL